MSSALFIAVQCCECSTMQVKQQKKSSNKWTCVVCNQKQSVLKVFSQSYMAKDVRQFVQSRNMARKIADEQASFPELEVTQEDPMMLPASSYIRSASKKRIDWSEYLDPAEDDPEQVTVDEGDVQVVTEMPPKRAKFRNGDHRLLNQQSKNGQVKEYLLGGSRKYEASRLDDGNRRNDDSSLLCNNKETVTSQLAATGKASKWDDYITNDEDEW